MLPFNPEDFNAEEENKPKIEPGQYDFRIVEAEMRYTEGRAGAKLEKGTPYLNLKLAAEVSEAKDVTVYDSIFFYSNSWLKKMNDFCNSIGIKFSNNIDPKDLEDKTGHANFKIGKNGYLDVAWYIDAKEAGGPSGSPVANARKQIEAESGNIPF